MTFGVKQADASKWIGEEEPEGDYAVWLENWPTVYVFMSMSTQWRVIASGMGGIHYQGLEYEALPATMSLMGIRRKDWPEIFAGLRPMEAAALKILNDRKRHGQ